MDVLLCITNSNSSSSCRAYRLAGQVKKSQYDLDNCPRYIIGTSYDGRGVRLLQGTELPELAAFLHRPRGGAADLQEDSGEEPVCAHDCGGEGRDIVRRLALLHVIFRGSLLQQVAWRAIPPLNALSFPEYPSLAFALFRRGSQ